MEISLQKWRTSSDQSAASTPNFDPLTKAISKFIGFF